MGKFFFVLQKQNFFEMKFVNFLSTLKKIHSFSASKYFPLKTNIRKKFWEDRIIFR